MYKNLVKGSVSLFNIGIENLDIIRNLILREVLEDIFKVYGEVNGFLSNDWIIVLLIDNELFIINVKKILGNFKF